MLNFLKTNRSHLRNAVPVKEAGDFAQDAIEFIYPNDIAVDESMILGTASLSDYFFGKEEMAKGAFRKLTEGKTEAKFF